MSCVWISASLLPPWRNTINNRQRFEIRGTGVHHAHIDWYGLFPDRMWTMDWMKHSQGNLFMTACWTRGIFIIYGRRWGSLGYLPDKKLCCYCQFWWGNNDRRLFRLTDVPGAIASCQFQAHISMKISTLRWDIKDALSSFFFCLSYSLAKKQGSCSFWLLWFSQKLRWFSIRNLESGSSPRVLHWEGLKTGGEKTKGAFSLGCEILSTTVVMF